MYFYVQFFLLNSAIAFASQGVPLILNDYLQPDGVTREQFLHPDSKSCARNCKAGEEPKICYYNWIAENYVTLGPACGDCPNTVEDCDAPQCVVADGFEKSILTINRMVPGPSIQVCLGDRIIVDLQNNMAAKSTTIHWHGVFQKGSQYMDGVPMLTQCSVHDGDNFRYDFKANNEGTHYWHSHDGLEKLDGIQGNLVIRTPQSADPNGKLYDFDLPEHNLMILDWLNTTADERFPGTLGRELGQEPVSFLLDGRGRQQQVPGQEKLPYFPYREVWVEKGKRYRLRLVGGLCTICGVEFTIEGHNMTLIATDGSPVVPITVGAIEIFSGERFDVVVEANQSPGTYWIHMRGLGGCALPGKRVYQLAVLRYENTNQARSDDDAPGYYPNFPVTGNVLNPENATCGSGQSGVCVSQLEGAEPDHEKILDVRPDVNINLNIGFKIFNPKDLFIKGEYTRYMVAPDTLIVASWMNNISFAATPSPLLSQGSDIPDDLFCPVGDDGFPSCPRNAASAEFCVCTHVIKIPLGAVTQIVLGDGVPLADLHHPFHLHGYNFYVIAMDQYRNGETLESISEKLLQSNSRTSKLPTLKDAIVVPSTGYAAIRFKADNPGVWYFHCHFMYHLVTGMSVVIQVGEDGDWPPVPPNFPKCGNYQPISYSEKVKP